jgi:hypothetical protein
MGISLLYDSFGLDMFIHNEMSLLKQGMIGFFIFADPGLSKFILQSENRQQAPLVNGIRLVCRAVPIVRGHIFAIVNIPDAEVKN